MGEQDSKASTPPERVSSAPQEKRGALYAGQRLFVRGLALLLPTVLTIFLLVKAYQFIDQTLIRYVNAGIHDVLTRVGFYEVFDPTAYSNWFVKNLLIIPVKWFFDTAFAFVLSILFIYAVGLFIGTLLGRRMWQAVESRLMRFPVIRFVYPFIRQVTDFIFSERDVSFRSVVAVEYPRKGVWSIGFTTGRGLAPIEKRAGRELVSVFIPSSPTPMTGYVVFTPAEEVVTLDMTVDEAFRLVISGGVIKPEEYRRFVASTGGKPHRLSRRETDAEVGTSSESAPGGVENAENRGG
jgi:uncharacterized membrane protein